MISGFICASETASFGQIRFGLIGSFSYIYMMWEFFLNILIICTFSPFYNHLPTLKKKRKWKKEKRKEKKKPFLVSITFDEDICVFSLFKLDNYLKWVVRLLQYPNLGTRMIQGGYHLSTWCRISFNICLSLVELN